MTMPGFKSQRRSRSAEPRGVEAVPSGSAPVPGWFPGPVTQGRTVTPPDTVAAAKDGQVFAALRRSTAGAGRSTSAWMDREQEHGDRIAASVLAVLSASKPPRSVNGPRWGPSDGVLRRTPLPAVEPVVRGVPAPLRRVVSETLLGTTTTGDDATVFRLARGRGAALPDGVAGRGSSLLRPHSAGVIRRDPSKVGEMIANLDEKRERVVDPIAENAENLGEVGESVAANIDIVVKINEKSLEEMEKLESGDEGGGDHADGDVDHVDGGDGHVGGDVDHADGDVDHVGGGDGHVEAGEVDHVEGAEENPLATLTEHFDELAKAFEAAATEALFFADMNKIVGGAAQISAGYELLKEDDSLSKNLGAQKVEKGVISVLSGGTGGVSHGISMVSAHVPLVGTVHNIKEGVIGAKGAIEDATAAEKLRQQTKKAKHLVDHNLPMKIRQQRFGEFLADYKQQELAGTQGDTVEQIKGWAKAKGGEFSRFDDAKEQFMHDHPTEPDPDADSTMFLSFLAAKGIKDFGKGTKYRDGEEQKFKDSRNHQGVNWALSPEEKQYEQARNLMKVAEFGHRRKAETATVGAVGAVGSVAYGVGDLTAGGDFGATKATGAALKVLKSGYTASKSIVKKSRRIEKTRTAKNKIGYGGESERGAGWFAKQLVVGDPTKQMDKARKSIESDGNRGQGREGHKASTPVLDGERAKLLKKLTVQRDRRAADLIGCLKADDHRLRYRARRLVHVIAETNLAGAIQTVEDADLQRLYDLHLTANQAGKTNAAKAEAAKELGHLESTLTEIFKMQLSGVGG